MNFKGLVAYHKKQGHSKIPLKGKHSLGELALKEMLAKDEMGEYRFGWELDWALSGYTGNGEYELLKTVALTCLGKKELKKVIEGRK